MTSLDTRIPAKGRITFRACDGSFMRCCKNRTWSTNSFFAGTGWRRHALISHCRARAKRARDLQEADIIRVLPSRPFACHDVPGDDIVDTLINGRYNRFHAEAKDILTFLMSHDCVSVRVLHERFAETYETEQIAELVSDLGDIGILVVERERD